MTTRRVSGLFSNFEHARLREASIQPRSSSISVKDLSVKNVTKNQMRLNSSSTKKMAKNLLFLFIVFINGVVS